MAEKKKVEKRTVKHGKKKTELDLNTGWKPAPNRAYYIRRSHGDQYEICDIDGDISKCTLIATNEYEQQLFKTQRSDRIKWIDRRGYLSDAGLIKKDGKIVPWQEI